jgi:hypothetical protein
LLFPGHDEDKHVYDFDKNNVLDNDDFFESSIFHDAVGAVPL